MFSVPTKKPTTTKSLTTGCELLKGIRPINGCNNKINEKGLSLSIVHLYLKPLSLSISGPVV